jgi:hypothetical protein
MVPQPLRFDGRPDARDIDDAVAHHSAVVHRVGGRHQPVADVKGQQPARARALDLGHQFEIPPDVIDVDGNTEHPAARRIDAVAHIERVPHRVHTGALGGGHRMQRLDRQRHSGRAGIFEKLRDAVFDLRVRGGDILARRAAGTGILREAPRDQHETRCAQRLRFIHRAAVVVARLDPVDRVGREHAAAAISGKRKPGVADCLGGALDPGRRNLIAPGVDRANAVPRAGLDDVEQCALLAHGRSVQRHPAMVAAQVAHQASIPRAARTVRIRATARSGSRRRPALSARRKISARCTVERALSWPPTSVK